MDTISPSEKLVAGIEILNKLNFATAGSEAQSMISGDLMQTTAEHLFGTIWSRPGLELQERSLLTLTVLVALNREQELVLHFRGARNLGISKEKLEEMILHVAHYAGWPCAVSANRTLSQVWIDMDEEESVQ